ncbi:MAG TPA: tetratricopeptide repeat protein [Polyangiaceae bacterium]|jgi:Tfp pilus assembly protein PilF
MRAHGPWVVGGLALLLHLGVLAELSSAPSFDVPIVDEATYDRLARDLLAGHGFDARLFWQGLLYPLELAAVYAATGGSLVAARIAQALAGSLAAALTCRLGDRAGGRRVGLLAGLIVACSGPLVFFDCELVATAWEVLWAAALPLLALRAADKPGRWRLFLFGAACAACVLTRASFAPFVVVALIWVARRAAVPSGRWLPAALCGAGVLALWIPAAVVARAATGSFDVLPYSGGINLYIGNNADADATVRIRPGEAWDRFASLPARHGATTPAAKEAYFTGLVADYAREHPGRFALGLANKSVELVTSREIPRNIDVYAYRAYSTILSAIVWRAGAFGFPFGVVFPLALVGLLRAWRTMPAPLLILLVTYPLAIVAVFVTARYRAPILPALAIAASAGVQVIRHAIASHDLRRAAGCAALVVAGVLASTWPGPFAAERGDHRAEMLTLVATSHLEHGRIAEAEPLLRDALESDPRDQVAHCVLGTVLTQRGDLDAAAAQFESALELDSQEGAALVQANANEGMGNVLLLRGTPPLALPYFLEALKYEPTDAPLLNDVGQILHGMGDDEEALAYLRRAVAADPTLDVAHRNLQAVEANLHAGAAP